MLLLQFSEWNIIGCIARVIKKNIYISKCTCIQQIWLLVLCKKNIKQWIRFFIISLYLYYRWRFNYLESPLGCNRVNLSHCHCITLINDTLLHSLLYFTVVLWQIAEDVHREFGTAEVIKRTAWFPVVYQLPSIEGPFKAGLTVLSLKKRPSISTLNGTIMIRK
jgi:hypothetical protein